MSCLSRMVVLAAPLTLALAAAPTHAQISLISAADLAIRSDPRVRIAQADVNKARAALSESKDVFIPSLVAGSGLGYSYGFPVGQPSIFNFTSQSLLFTFSQHDYIRSAGFALKAANSNFLDARQTVLEETAIAYITLDRDIAREAALNEQQGFADRLVRIVDDRLQSGQDRTVDLVSAKLTAAQVRLARLHAEDETAMARQHLSQLTGLPATGLTTSNDSVPGIDHAHAASTHVDPMSIPSVASAFDNARAKREIAFGDSRYLWRPQIFFAAQYNRFAKYNGYDAYYKNFQHNNAGIGIQINLPIFDRVHNAKARESAADADRAEQEANLTRNQFLSQQVRLDRSMTELEARAEVADLELQLAQQQLEIVQVQLQTGPGGSGAAPLSPKDEQTSRIARAEKLLGAIDARFQVRQAGITLLRQQGELESWLRSAAQP